MIAHGRQNLYGLLYQFLLLSISLTFKQINAEYTQNPSLPLNHLPIFEAQIIEETTSKKDHICWGHESNCDVKNSFSANFTKCNPRTQNTQKSREIFFNEADFGYIKQRKENLMNICSERPDDSIQSSIKCTNQLQFCTGKNVRIDFRGIESRSDGSLRYNMNVLKPGQITGKCRVNKVVRNFNNNAMIH